jgi:hypothetical protein
MADFLKNIIGGSKSAEPAPSGDSGEFTFLAYWQSVRLQWDAILQ